MTENINRLRILFLCIGSSCRSQIAEAWTQKLEGDLVEPFSAGVNPVRIDPLTVEVMAEEELDISGNTSKGIDALGKKLSHYIKARDQIRSFVARLPETYNKLTTRRIQWRSKCLALDVPNATKRKKLSKKPLMN